MDWQLVGAIGLGTIIGSVITTLGNFLVHERQSRQEFKTWLREKKYNLYLEIMEACYEGRHFEIVQDTARLAEILLLSDEAQIERLWLDLRKAQSENLNSKEIAHIVVILSSFLRKDLRGCNDRPFYRIADKVIRLMLRVRLETLKRIRHLREARELVEVKEGSDVTEARNIEALLQDIKQEKEPDQSKKNNGTGTKRAKRKSSSQDRKEPKGLT